MPGDETGGYRDIAILDQCPFDKNFYRPSDGCDSASADLSKVFRMSFGKKVEYVSALWSIFTCTSDPLCAIEARII